MKNNTLSKCRIKVVLNMEEGDSSFKNWQFWCRLCGNLGSQQHINMYNVIEGHQPVFVENEQEITLLKAIDMHLNMTIAQNDKLPKMICPHCTEFIKSFTIYYKHVHNVQKMFKTIYENDLVEWYELDEVRKTFGISKKEFAPLSRLNVDKDDDIVSVVIADQLSCVPTKEEMEKQQQEKLGELECGIETDIYLKESSEENDHIIWSTDDENLQETLDNCTSTVEISNVQNIGGDSTENCETIQTKPNGKRTRLVQKTKKLTIINVTCNHCHEQFDYFKQYREHLIEKHNKQKESKKWECPKCEKSLTSIDGLGRHIENHVLSNKEKEKKKKKKIDITCNHCDEEFQYYEPYHEHLIEKHNKQTESRNWECPLCEKSLVSSYGLKRHLRNHIPNELYEFSCTNCNKKFPTRQSLKDHIRHTHSLERYVCEECGVIVKNKRTLRLHKLTHSEEEPFECNVCKKRFKCGPLLRTHMETHDNRKHICNICGLKLNTRATLRNHMKVHDGIKKFKCDLCEKVFTRKASLQSHMDSHAGQKLYACDICGLGFTYHSNVHRHKINMHPEKCATLKKSRNNENLIFKHACNICDLQFNTRLILRRHMKVHDDVKKFKCDLCDKVFKFEAQLKKHLVSHAGLKLYTCDICGLGFVHRSNIRRHKINIHPEKWAALEKSTDNEKAIYRLPSIETLQELAARNFNCGDGKKHKQNKK